MVHPLWLSNKIMCLSNFQRYGSVMIQILSEIRMQHYQERLWHQNYICNHRKYLEGDIPKMLIFVWGVFAGCFWLLAFRFPVSTCQLPYQPFPDNRNLKNEYPVSHKRWKTSSVLIYLILTTCSLAHTECSKYKC